MISRTISPISSLLTSAGRADHAGMSSADLGPLSPNRSNCRGLLRRSLNAFARRSVVLADTGLSHIFVARGT